MNEPTGFCRACLGHGAIKGSSTTSIRPSARLFVNICDQPSVDFTVNIISGQREGDNERLWNAVYY